MRKIVCFSFIEKDLVLLCSLLRMTAARYADTPCAKPSYKRKTDCHQDQMTTPEVKKKPKKNSKPVIVLSDEEDQNHRGTQSFKRE